MIRLTRAEDGEDNPDRVCWLATNQMGDSQVCFGQVFMTVKESLDTIAGKVAQWRRAN